MPAVSVQELPSLKSLPLELSRFAFSYLSKSLGLPKPVDPRGRPSIEELNRVLLDNLVEDKAGSALQTKGGARRPHVLQARQGVAYCAAHQSHPGQGSLAWFASIPCASLAYRPLHAYRYELLRIPACSYRSSVMMPSIFRIRTGRPHS